MLIGRASAHSIKARARNKRGGEARGLALSGENFYTGAMNFSAFLRFRLITVAAAIVVNGASAPEKIIVLKAARLFDGKSKALVQNGVVIVQGSKIVDAGSNLSVPTDAQVIDLGDATLSPGFMDGQTHLAHDYTDHKRERMEQIDLNVSEKALRATVHARATLEAGFTTVRDLGSR